MRRSFLMNLYLVGCLLISACTPKQETLNSLKGLDEIKALHTIGTSPTLIDQDWAIQGIVTANNSSGNFANQLIIQSGTSGLLIYCTESTITSLQIGDQILIKVNGFYIGDENGMPSLYASADNKPIDLSSIEIDIISSENNVVALTYPIANISTLQAGTMIKLNGVEWPTNDQLTILAGRKMLMDCDSNQIQIRTSSDAIFSTQLTSDKNGTVQGIVFFELDTAFLKIRTIDEVTMEDSLCAQGGGNTSADDILPIDSIKALYSGTVMPAPNGKYIKGIVISDKNSGNITGKNVVIQDQSAGITVRFDANNTFELGDEILVDMSGAELSEYNGLFQINFTPLANTIKLSSGNTVAPRATNIPDIMANGEAWESTLIEIYQVTYTTSTGTFAGLGSFEDGTNTIPTYVRSAATFAADNVPTGTIDTVIAMVSDFNGTQLIIRNASDVGQ